jgi:hypothetical protein
MRAYVPNAACARLPHLPLFFCKLPFPALE